MSKLKEFLRQNVLPQSKKTLLEVERDFCVRLKINIQLSHFILGRAEQHWNFSSSFGMPLITRDFQQSTWLIYLCFQIYFFMDHH